VQDLVALAALYAEIDAYLEALRAALIESGDGSGADRIEAKQRLNDQAYFVICWGQLESAIDDACRSAIRARRGHADWAVRRAWDLYNPDEKRLSGLSFEDRTALVLDRQGGAKSPWARVQFYYALRNQIAHGKLRPERIDVTAVVGEMYVIQGALTP
jgi:hypothetical protein